MRLGTKANIFHRLGLINGQVQAHQEILDELLDGQLKMAGVVVKNSEFANYIAEFSTDMAGLLVDLMADVNEMGKRTGNPHIAERIDARADIAAAMLKLQSERINSDES